MSDIPELSQDQLNEIEFLRRQTPEERRRSAAAAATQAQLAEIERQADFYAEYIQSDEWRARADAAKARAGHRCQVCNSGYRLEAHHRTYANLGHEDEMDITVLCDDCHGLFHRHKRLKR